VLPIVLSLSLTSLVILLVGENPVEVLELVIDGALGDVRSLAGVVNFWLPLLLACMGLVMTFRAGLWNIGVEGQIMIGAVCATGVALYPPNFPSEVVIGLSILAGMLGGAVWGLLIGFLKTRLGVHEIFGGTGLNALANLVAIYLISGPWLPAEGGSAQGTSPIPAVSRLTSMSADFPVSGLMLALVVVASLLVIVALGYTRWGLQLKATGKNARSALLLGVPVERTLWSSLILCGLLAGLAGAYRVMFVYNNLRPLLSGGIGFLALLAVLLAGMRAVWVPLIAFTFSVILVGSTRLKITLQLDQSLAGVLQGALVLVSLFVNGLRERASMRRTQTPVIVSDAEEHPLIKAGQIVEGT
jgi:general nucleoside transport system permease protein